VLPRPRRFSTPPPPPPTRLEHRLDTVALPAVRDRRIVVPGRRAGAVAGDEDARAVGGYREGVGSVVRVRGPVVAADPPDGARCSVIREGGVVAEDGRADRSLLAEPGDVDLAAVGTHPDRVRAVGAARGAVVAPCPQPVPAYG